MAQKQDVKNRAKDILEETLDREAAIVLARISEEMQMMFQDPFGSLNPRLTVGPDAFRGAFLCTRVARGAEARQRVNELLDVVGLSREDLQPLSPMSFPAVSASGSALPEPLPSTRNSLYAMSRFRRLMCRFSRRLSISSKICSGILG